MTVKKTTTTTQPTVKEAPSNEQDQVVNIVDEVKEVKAVPAKKAKLELNMLVECKNVTGSHLTYVSKKTHAETNWLNTGDIEFLELSELLTMKGSQAKFLNEPWIIIEDEDVVAYLGLTKVYQNIVNVEELDQLLFYTSPQDIESIIAKAPRGTKEMIADKARALVASEELYDIRVIKALNKALQIDLTFVQN